MISAIIIGPTYELAAKQMEVECDLYELRLDYFDEINLDQISKLLTKPCILTLRSTSKRSEEERIQLLRQLANLKPAYIDLETTVPREVIEEIAMQTKIILSYHNFDHTPELEISAIPATYYKMATMANSSLDCWRMLDLVKKHKNLIGFCLGEKGTFSRILSAIYGSPITYAYLDEPTAPGQISLEELKSYSLTPDTKLFAVIGYPLTTSSSPAFHNQKYREWGINAVYVKMPFQADELAQFAPRMQGFSGLSVTMPLKESILPYLDQIDVEAAEIGAVNTIVCKEGKTKGYNTDGKGALDAIGAVEGKTVIILGAGGAARAIIYEAKKRGARVLIWNRTVEKGKLLAEHFDVEAISEMQPYHILVNTTPVDVQVEIAPNTTVMDIRSHPKLTPFLERAAQKNCRLIYGMEMFHYQALEQIRLWELERG